MFPTVVLFTLKPPKEDFKMRIDRINKLATFLASNEIFQIDISTKRPSPDAGNTLVMKSFLVAHKAKLARGDPDALAVDIQGNFTRVPGLADRINSIWNTYGSDETFFAWLKTMRSTSL